MDARRYELDMCSGPLAGKLLVFSLPLMASGVLQLLFNAADVVVVGRFAGKESLAAVGSTTSLVNLLISLFIGLSIGCSVTVAQDLGAGRQEDVSKGVHTSILLALISGVILAVLGVAGARWLLEQMRSPEDVIDLATVYLRIFFLGMPATMAYNFGSALLRAKGDTRRPLYFLAFAGVLNVGMNLYYVLVLGMGVAGVATATALSQYVSAGLVLYCLVREEGPLRLERGKLALDGRTVRRILRVGLPAGVQGIVFSLSNVVVQQTVNTFGSTVMSGNAASQSVEGFIFTAMNCFHQTAITFSGQNYGAGQCRRVDRTAELCAGYAVLTGLILGTAARFAGPWLLDLYAPGETDVIYFGMVRLGIITRTYFICGVMDVLAGTLRGLGNSFLPMVVSLVGACGLRLLWIYTVFPLNPTLEVLFLSYPISWAVTAMAHGVAFMLIRKRAYGVFGAREPAYRAVEGQHPVP